MKKFIVLPLMAMAAISSAQVAWVSSASGVLNLMETIVDNGNGTYTYNYSLTNSAEPLPIWWVVVYMNVAPGAAAGTPFGDGGHVGWDYYEGTPSPDIDAPEGQLYVAFSWASGDPWPGSAPNGVGMGETVGGFSYTSTSLDTSAKRFVADREGDWGPYNLGYNGDDQIFSYGGFTSAVPEPATLATLGLGLAALIRRRKA
ncbi:MAG: hypothetical protein AMXMBFR19_10800 [Chthonomonadaceae bacterium]|uniref:PEP-CTERM motif protein n=1 Tax=Candidatus Nitrosymbiomonas proteolyticus TaxID=2608984 RepID=A0A809RX91_9BACT|nr:MAG: PEP-CTERM sorting domain-containing protein [Armatimonadota bacterium]BBO24522.1 PEP-CTERM motif protein [Candidatus Nitrosymbiomonas proteolyticus]